MKTHNLTSSEGEVRAVRMHKVLASVLLTLSMLLFGISGMAYISEPDNIIYGRVTSNGLPLETGEITLSVNGGPAPLVRCQLGSDPALPSSYILRVPLDTQDPQAPGTARPGDLAGIYINGQLAATVQLGERGTVLKLPLSVCSQPAIFYRDADGDGYADSSSITSCQRPDGYKTASELIASSADCNDSDPLINPGAAEVCNARDDNCNGQTDESGDVPFYRDADGDGYGNQLLKALVCSQPSGYVADNTDCNDSDSKEHPQQLWYRDTDNDGYSDLATNQTSCTRPSGYKTASELKGLGKDCNDNTAFVYPGAAELCDKKDNNCDDLVDNECSGYAGKMSRNSYVAEAAGWIVRAFSEMNAQGKYNILLEVDNKAGSAVPAGAISGFTSNPLMIAQDATAPDVVLTFDRVDGAYILYTTPAGHRTVKVKVSP